MRPEELIRDVPDFPRPGIVFKDITPLLLDAAAFRETVERVARPFTNRADVVLGIESRGFIVGAAVAYHLGAGFAIARKPGKLPAAFFEARYALEYGTDALQIHRDAFRDGARVLIVDDLLATGGTAAAAVELAFLHGRQRLEPVPVHSVIRYGAE